MTFAVNIFGDMEKALYKKGSTKVQVLTAMDDTSKTLETLVAFLSGTAITRYLEPKLEESKKAKIIIPIKISKFCFKIKK